MISKVLLVSFQVRFFVLDEAVRVVVFVVVVVVVALAPLLGKLTSHSLIDH